MPAFDVHDWRAWSPRLVDSADWLQWAGDDGYLGRQEPAQPDVSFLAPMQRRRLGLMARMFFQVAQPLAGLGMESGAGMPVVFSSRHGDTRQTTELLGSMARADGMSPTAFGLSVHNATTGLWSIQTQQTGEMLATASIGDSLEHALLEACGLLEEGAERVLVVLAEDLPADEYSPWIDDVPFPYAVALVLRRGTAWQLDLVDADADADASSAPAAVPATPLEGVRRLLRGCPAWFSHQGGRRWHWRQ